MRGRWVSYPLRVGELGAFDWKGCQSNSNSNVDAAKGDWQMSKSQLQLGKRSLTLDNGYQRCVRCITLAQ